MKKLTVSVLAGIMALSLCACGDDDSSSTANSSGSAETSAAADESVYEPAAEDSSAPEAENTPAPEADLSNPDVTIAFGDYEGQMALSKSIQNVEMTGKVVCIDGIVSQGFTSYSIGQDSGSGEYTGTVFTVEGMDPSEYPAEKSHVKLTGVVVYDEDTWVSSISVLPENFEIIEAAGVN